MDAGTKGTAAGDQVQRRRSAVRIRCARVSISGSTSARCLRTADSHREISRFRICTCGKRRWMTTRPPDVGLGWAAFILGMPTTMSVDTNDTYALMSPYYAWYGQDTWRVTRNLTLTLGLRMEYERGATERYNRAISYFDPNLELPISAAAEAAYARNPVPELPASQFKVRGGSVYAGRNGAPRELWQSELMWLPRISAAWQPANEDRHPRWLRDLLRHPQRDELRSQSVWVLARYNTQLTKDAGTNWLAGDPQNGISPLVDPFPVRANGTRFDVPLQDALGSMARAGQDFTFGVMTVSIRGCNAGESAFSGNSVAT